MVKIKVLLCGDSFSADYTPIDKEGIGWPTLLAQDVDLTNVSNAGSSEYRIWRQVRDNVNSSYDYVIVSHTSPYRIYIEQHPLHSESLLHKNCDLIYNDIKGRNLDYIEHWFEKCFSDEQARDVHQLLIKDIDTMCNGNKILHIGHLDISAPKNFNFVSFNKEWKKHQGTVNHYNRNGNQKVYAKLKEMIDKEKNGNS